MNSQPHDRIETLESASQLPSPSPEPHRKRIIIKMAVRPVTGVCLLRLNGSGARRPDRARGTLGELFVD